MITYLRNSAGLIGLLALLASMAMFMGHDAQAQTNFFPCGSTELSTTEPNQPVDITVTFGLGLNDACEPQVSATDGGYLGGILAFAPAEFILANDAEVPDGTVVGQFAARATLGLLENGCNSLTTTPFVLFEATTDRSNTIDAKPPGEPDRLSPMADNNGDGIPDGALQWPSYLDSVAADVGMDLSQLVGRNIGVNQSSIAGLTIVLNFLVFEPGATVTDLINIDPRLGYPAVTVLQDPSQTASNEDPVNDFCTPLWTTAILNGTAGGVTYRETPAAGTYNFTVYTAAALDEDGDGIENVLDPCPLTANASGWDPRGPKTQNPGDQDGDGLPDDCDPFPTTPSTNTAGVGIANSDEDGDGWSNRNDNCTLISNPDQADDDNDGLGDVCDPENVRGGNPATCLVSAVDIGGGGEAPVDPQTLAPCDPNAVVPSDGGDTGGGDTGGGDTGGGDTGGGDTGGGGTSGGTAGGTSGGVGGGPDSGIGSLAVTGSGAPLWATVLAALGFIGFVVGAGLTGSALWRRR